MGFDWDVKGIQWFTIWVLLANLAIYWDISCSLVFNGIPW